MFGPRLQYEADSPKEGLFKLYSKDVEKNILGHC